MKGKDREAVNTGCFFKSGSDGEERMVAGKESRIYPESFLPFLLIRICETGPHVQNE